jgi:cell wall-associated NlpC family hydrolase
MSHWSSQYIGLPWESGAQGPDAFDCWAFVRHVQSKHFGRDLPLIDVDANNRSMVHAAFAIHPERQRWAQVEQPSEGDCVLVHKGRFADHVGMWVDVDGGRILHAVPRAGVVCTSIQALRRLGWNPIEFYRFAGV